MSREFKIQIEAVENEHAPDGWAMVVIYDRDEAKEIPNRLTIIENGLINRIEQVVRGYIHHIQNGGQA